MISVADRAASAPTKPAVSALGLRYGVLSLLEPAGSEVASLESESEHDGVADLSLETSVPTFLGPPASGESSADDEPTDGEPADAYGSAAGSHQADPEEAVQASSSEPERATIGPDTELFWIQRRRLNRDRALEPPIWLREQPMRRGSNPALDADAPERPQPDEEGAPSTVASADEEIASLESHQPRSSRKSRELSMEVADEILGKLIRGAAEDTSLLDELYEELAIRLRDRQAAKMSSGDRGGDRDGDGNGASEAEAEAETEAEAEDKLLRRLAKQMQEIQRQQQDDELASQARERAAGQLGEPSLVPTMLADEDTSNVDESQAALDFGASSVATGGPDGGGYLVSAKAGALSTTGSAASRPTTSLEGYDEEAVALPATLGAESGGPSTEPAGGALELRSARLAVQPSAGQERVQAPGQRLKPYRAREPANYQPFHVLEDIDQVEDASAPDVLAAAGELGAALQQQQQQQQQQQVQQQQQQRLRLAREAGFERLTESGGAGSASQRAQKRTLMDGAAFDEAAESRFGRAAAGRAPLALGLAHRQPSTVSPLQVLIGGAQVSGPASEPGPLAGPLDGPSPSTRSILGSAEPLSAAPNPLRPVDPHELAARALVESGHWNQAQLAQMIGRVKAYIEDLISIPRNSIIGIYPMDARRLLIKLDVSKLNAQQMLNLWRNYDYARSFIVVSWPPEGGLNPVPMISAILRSMKAAQRTANRDTDRVLSFEADEPSSTAPARRLPLAALAAYLSAIERHTDQMRAELERQEKESGGAQQPDQEDEWAAESNGDPSLAASARTSGLVERLRAGPSGLYYLSGALMALVCGLMMVVFVRRCGGASSTSPLSRRFWTSQSSLRSLWRPSDASFHEPPASRGARGAEGAAPSPREPLSASGHVSGPGGGVAARAAGGAPGAGAASSASSEQLSRRLMSLLERFAPAPYERRPPADGKQRQANLSRALESAFEGSPNESAPGKSASADPATGLGLFRALQSRVGRAGALPADVERGELGARQPGAKLAAGRRTRSGRPTAGFRSGSAENSLELEEDDNNDNDNDGQDDNDNDDQDDDGCAGQLEASLADESELSESGLRTSRSYIRSLIQVLARARSQIPVGTASPGSAVGRSWPTGGATGGKRAARVRGDDDEDEDEDEEDELEEGDEGELAAGAPLLARAAREQRAGATVTTTGTGACSAGRRPDSPVVTTTTTTTHEARAEEESLLSQMDISAAHLILAYMEKHLEDKERLQREWIELNGSPRRHLSAKISELTLQRLAKVALAEENRARNRNPLVVPFDRNRVRLRAAAEAASGSGSVSAGGAARRLASNGRRSAAALSPGASPGDYINASFIYDADPRRPTHIIAQGPTEQTVGHFWQMVWEEGVAVVVMLTRLNENGASMCHCYWPSPGAPAAAATTSSGASSASSCTPADEATPGQPSPKTTRRGSVASVLNGGAGARQPDGVGQAFICLEISADGQCRQLVAGQPDAAAHAQPAPNSAAQTNGKASTRLEVHLVSEHVSSADFLVRNMYMINRATGETRTITQFHYLAWLEGGVPDNVRSFLHFRRKVHKSYRQPGSPILVHCSDGAGRSGTYTLIDMILERIRNGAKEIDPRATLEHLRDQRLGLCANQAQFEFVLVALAEEIQIILNALPH